MLLAYVKSFKFEKKKFQHQFILQPYQKTTTIIIIKKLFHDMFKKRHVTYTLESVLGYSDYSLKSLWL